MSANPNQDLVNINAYANFGQNSSIRTQDVERKRKLTCNNPNLDPVNINAFASFCQNP